MKTVTAKADALEQFVAAREVLLERKSDIEQRLVQINLALERMASCLESPDIRRKRSKGLASSKPLSSRVPLVPNRKKSPSREGLRSSEEQGADWVEALGVY